MWDLEPGSQAPNHCCFLCEVTLSALPQAGHTYFHLSLFSLSIPHSSHKPSLNHLLSSMFLLAPDARLALGRKQEVEPWTLPPNTLPSSCLDEMNCLPNRSSWGWGDGPNLKADSQETGHSRKNMALVGFSSSTAVGCLSRWPQMSKGVEVGRRITITSKERTT